MGLFWNRPKYLDDATHARLMEIDNGAPVSDEELSAAIDLLEEKRDREGQRFYYKRHLDSLQRKYEYRHESIGYWSCGRYGDQIGDHYICKPYTEYFLEHLEDALRHPVRDVTVTPLVVVAVRNTRVVTERRKVNEVEVIDGITGSTSGGSYSGSSYHPSGYNSSSYSGSFSGTTSEYDVQSHREDVFADVDRTVIGTEYRDYRKNTFTEAVEDAKAMSRHQMVLKTYVIAHLKWHLDHYRGTRDVLIESYEYGCRVDSVLKTGTPSSYENSKRYWLAAPKPATGTSGSVGRKLKRGEPGYAEQRAQELTEEEARRRRAASEGSGGGGSTPNTPARDPPKPRTSSHDFWTSGFTPSPQRERDSAPKTNQSFESYKRDNFTFEDLPGFKVGMLDSLMGMDIYSTDDLRRMYHVKET